MNDTTITTGVIGTTWRASITPAGTLLPWDGDPLRWYVAAEDRWHVPEDEPSVRQRRVDGTAVTETRVRVPNGDVVQRIASVPDGGGTTVIEFENESPSAVAIALDRGDVLTERPPADVPIEGIELPAGAIVLPLGHRASVRVGLAHDGRGAGALPSGLPAIAQVVRGWTTLTERASRFVLPDGEPGAAIAERITAQRCELALGNVPHAGDDPAGFALALGELVRMGEHPDPWLPELVEAVERVGPDPAWAAGAALRMADRVLSAAGETRARRDLARIASARALAARPETAPDGPAIVAWLEMLLADGPALLPAGLPPAWLGQSFECYGVPTSGEGAVSFAVRWHGERPAVLWEQTGESVELTAPVVAPEWRSSDVRGEALWPPPDPVTAERALSESVAAESDPPTSFS